MKTKDKRREMRVSEHDDDLLVEAAGLLGVTVSEFVLSTALGDAESIVQAHRSIVLDADAHARFLEALDGPSTPIDALAGQIRKSRRLKRVE